MTDEERQENISSETIQNIYEIMTIKAVETMDDFIFQTIRPYCELVSQRKISKDNLKRALTAYFKNHSENRQRSGRNMTKAEVKISLDDIRDMSDEEIADNAAFIRKAAEEAFALIKNLERRRQ